MSDSGVTVTPWRMRFTMRAISDSMIICVSDRVLLSSSTPMPTRRSAPDSAAASPVCIDS